MVPFVTDIIHRLARPPEEIRAENLRRWASSIRHATPIAEATPRKRSCVAGVVNNIRIDPRQGSGWIEATITDGSGEMTARWLGRQRLAGIRLGMGIVVKGTVGTGDDDEPVILNPEYELIPGPEHH